MSIFKRKNQMIFFAFKTYSLNISEKFYDCFIIKKFFNKMVKNG